MKAKNRWVKNAIGKRIFIVFIVLNFSKFHLSLNGSYHNSVENVVNRAPTTEIVDRLVQALKHRSDGHGIGRSLPATQRWTADRVTPCVILGHIGGIKNQGDAAGPGVDWEEL